MNLEQCEKFGTTLFKLLGDKTSKTIKNEPYMPLHVENIGNDCISVSHTYEQNGDLMRDPEVVFKLIDGRFALPVYFRNDGAGIETGSYWDEEIVPDESLSSFCRMWFRNLKDQGFVEA
jgi:hypothetical protein